MNRLYSCFVRIALIVVLHYLSLGTLRAQIGYLLTGTVRDSATGRGLPRATILIDYEKMGKGTYTDEQGQFLVSLPAGKHIVVVRKGR